MAESISIKERIERVLRVVVGEMAGVGRVYHWDMRGIVDPDTGSMFDGQGQRLALQAYDAVIFPLEEAAAEGGQGSGGFTEKTMTVQVAVKLQQAENQAEQDGGAGGGPTGDDALTSSALHNRWLLRLETALMANSQLYEKAVGDEAGEFTGVQLAIDSRITATGRPPEEEGQREMMTAVMVEITYQHERANPATGPGIEALVE